MAKKTKKTPFHSHALASLTSVAPHVHTGKKLPSKHTSHGSLLIILLLTGILLFSNLGVLKAYGVTSHSGTSINVSVSGDPPTIGATITFPVTNTISSNGLLEVRGICPSETLVSVYNNGSFAGSTTCSTDGDFTVIIQLQKGLNVIQAQNYDALNQPGPITSQLSITYEPIEIIPGTTDSTLPSPEVVVNTPTQLHPVPVVPLTPAVAPQPSVQPCYKPPSDTTQSSDTSLTISVSCIYRNIFVGDTLHISVFLKGGLAPYALLTSWGDDQSDLTSVSDSSPQMLSHIYDTAGIHKILLKTTDKNGATSQIQTVVSVNSDATTVAPTKQTNTFLRDLGSVWIEAPVPLYIAAVTLVSGFWVGDIFQRLHAKTGVRRHHLRP